jgi:AsmA protein
VASKAMSGVANYQGSLVIPSFNPTELLNSLGINYQPQDSSAFKSVSAKLDFQGPITAIKTTNLQVLLDRSVLQGSITNLNLKQKSLNFALGLNEFNLNRYLPKTTITTRKVKTTYAKSGVTQSSTGAQLTVSPKRTSVQNKNSATTWSLNGNLNIGQLTLGKILATKVSLPIKINNMTIALAPKANFYNGTFNGQINIDLRGNLPKTTANLNLAKVSLEPLLSVLANSNSLSGTVNFKANISTIGSESSTILKNLNGKGSLEITNGALNFMDINSIFVFVKNILNIAVAPVNIITTQKLPTFKEGTGITKFDSLTAIYVISNGIITNKDLLLTTPSYKVTGQGTVNLVSQKVDYLLNASTAAITINKQNLGLVQIPIKISGTFNNLHYYPDTTQLLKSLTVGTIQNVGKTISDTLQKGGNVGQNLKDVGKNIGKSLGF